MYGYSTVDRQVIFAFIIPPVKKKHKELFGTVSTERKSKKTRQKLLKKCLNFALLEYS